MSHKSFSYKGYDICLANLQASKLARGGVYRSMQVMRGNLIVKSIRYKRLDPEAYGKASEKATKWIDDQAEKK
jgi:hypothetical protein